MLKYSVESISFIFTVLVDEHKRVIYDLYGEKGLESFGMEVISRTKTPAEIIAEYERFQQEQEERRLRQRTNPRVRASNCFIILRYNKRRIFYFKMEFAFTMALFGRF